MYKATYLRALPAATKDTGGALGKLLHTKGAAKTRTVYSIHTLVGFKNILLEVDDRGGRLSKMRLFAYRCPSLCGCPTAVITVTTLPLQGINGCSP